MAKNMYCEGNKVPNDKFRDNYDKIFGKKKDKCSDGCDCGDGCCKKKEEK